MKKIITVFLSLMASVALWAHDLEVDSIYYNLFGEDNVEVTYFGRWPGGSYSGAVVIPETVEYNGMTYHVTRIGVSAFAECPSLTSISIPESITHIGSRAFWGCSSLEYVYIPKSVTKIESAAFAGCSALNAIDVPKTNEVYNSHDNCKAIVETATNTLIAGCKNSRINISVEHIAEYAFYGCTGLTEISIPMSVETIGAEAFSGCTSLKSIKIPNTTYNIEGQAFYGCSSLTSVELPYDLKTIKSFTFAGCSSLTNFDIPNKVTTIGGGAFENCSSLKTINLHDGITQIGNQAFAGCTSLSSITIPNGITMIGDGTFANCSSLTYIYIPNTVEWIGWSVFSGCSSLKSIDLSDKLRSIPYGTFHGCSTLTSITVPNSVTSIGEVAFLDCSALESIKISENVTNIEKQAFLNCTSLKSIYIPDAVTRIGEQAFWECSSLTSVTIGNGLQYTGEYVFYGSPITSVIWNAKHFEDPYWGSRMALFQGNNTITSFVIGDSVEHIPAYLCYGIMSLSSITIPKYVTSIGNCAFAGCPSLNSINVHDGNRIFDSRNQCNAIIETASNTLVAGCKTTIIPDGIDSIGKYAFYDCDELTSISIPQSVKSIGFEAFRSCSTLDTIYCNATTPPSLEETTFTDDSGIIRATVTLYVHCESLEAYKAHEVWGQFENVQCIEEEQPQADNLYYRYVMNADNTVLSETLLTQESFDKFTTVSVKGDQQWTFSSSYGATMNGNSVNITYPNEDWLISPALDLAGKANAILSFEHCFGPASAIPTTEAEKAQYTIWVSNDFTGDVQSATWTQLNGMMYGTAAWKYVSSGNIEIPANYLTENCRVAWKYVCEDASAKWEIKNVLVTTPTNQVEVVAGENKYSGDITIPATTIFNGQKCDVVGIAEEAFYDCSALISITIPNSMKHIGESAFRGCNALEKTNFMGDIADWCDIKFGGAYANPISASYNFYLNDSEVKDLVIPNTVDSIHAYAFDCGNSITSIALPNSVVYIGEGAFYRTYINEIIIPKSVTSIEERVLSGCNALTSIIVEEGNPVYDSRDNSNAIIETNSNTLIAGCATTNIPGTIMHIGPYAFSYLSSLKTIEIPNSVITIGDYAFYACSYLESITLPNSVSHIGYWALYACYSLNSIVVEEGNSVYDSRNNCNAIIETTTNSLIVACQNTVIPEGVTNIGEDAFFNCRNITSITLPNSVTNIEPFAFDFCSSLDTIYCYSTTPPTIHKYSFDNYNATLYVPCASIAEYTAHEVWSLFTNIQCIEDVETSIENTQSQSPMTDCQKIIRNGQLVIIRDGKTYNAIGQEL